MNIYIYIRVCVCCPFHIPSLLGCPIAETTRGPIRNPQPSPSAPKLATKVVHQDYECYVSHGGVFLKWWYLQIIDLNNGIFDSPFMESPICWPKLTIEIPGLKLFDEFRCGYKIMGC